MLRDGFGLWFLGPISPPPPQTRSFMVWPRGVNFDCLSETVVPWAPKCWGYGCLLRRRPVGRPTPPVLSRSDLPPVLACRAEGRFRFSQTVVSRRPASYQSAHHHGLDNDAEVLKVLACSLRLDYRQPLIRIYFSCELILWHPGRRIWLCV